MDKLHMRSRDVVGSNVEKIAALFPQCVTERLNKDGKPELAIDFDKLRAELSNEATSSRGPTSVSLHTLQILQLHKRSVRMSMPQKIFGILKTYISRATILMCLKFSVRII